MTDQNPYQAPKSPIPEPPRKVKGSDELSPLQTIAVAAGVLLTIFGILTLMA